MLFRPARPPPQNILANAGTYAPLEIKAPEGSLVNATYPAAVVAGNVETSNRIADTVLAALSGFAPEDVPAQGQGTMNNTIIGGSGNGGWTYYETIGGGQGASSKGPGPSGVHIGMSNTLNTPIEAFELEYPMRVERYELRYGSGGAGEHRGGDGIERSVKVLEPASLSSSPTAGATPRAASRVGSPGRWARTSSTARSYPQGRPGARRGGRGYDPHPWWRRVRTSPGVVTGAGGSRKLRT